MSGRAEGVSPEVMDAVDFRKACSNPDQARRLGGSVLFAIADGAGLSAGLKRVCEAIAGAGN